MRNFIQNRAARYSDVPNNLLSPRCRDKIKAILDNHESISVKDEYNHDDVREKLRLHFNIKCVYCESMPIATSSFRVDHFRPKKGIKDTNETGYYWLAYEWTNFMQSCQLCNGVKSNYFPLRDNATRVTAKTPNALDAAYWKPDLNPLINEMRLLLHPELDDVELHFSFKPDGSIYSITDEGNASIACYGLQRADLVYARKSLNDEVLRVIKRALVDYETDLLNDSVLAEKQLFRVLRNEFTRMLTNYKENREYSLFWFTMFDRFTEFIVEQLLIQEHKDVVGNAYLLFKQNKLV